jgi:hypothetical protein
MISTRHTDKSNVLASRYATLVADYFDHPDQACTPAASVPLENLFRMLEMYRYGAFSDEGRRGVLAMVSRSESTSVRPSLPSWHEPIERALNKALTDTFADVSKEEAVVSLQNSLRLLVSNKGPDATKTVTAKQFFTNFSQALS